MGPIGAFTFVLHSHLPYCRRAGRWPHGEEWLHEAAAETYIPLLNALTDLYEEGTRVRLTLGLTPVLCEQLADPLVKDHFEAYLEDASPDEEVVLNQAARELLLLEASDWPFLVTTGQAREYAIQRFTSHVDRFEQLVGSVEAGRPDRARAEELWELDKVFPDVDFRWWG